MQRLEVSCAVRPIYGSLGAKGLMKNKDTETLTITCIVHESHLHAGSRRISNFSLAVLASSDDRNVFIYMYSCHLIVSHTCHLSFDQSSMKGLPSAAGVALRVISTQNPTTWWRDCLEQGCFKYSVLSIYHFSRDGRK
jgi:hypothetical protein